MFFSLPMLTNTQQHYLSMYLSGETSHYSIVVVLVSQHLNLELSQVKLFPVCPCPSVKPSWMHLAYWSNKALSHCDSVCFLVPSSFSISHHWLIGLLCLVVVPTCQFLKEILLHHFLVDLGAVALWHHRFPVPSISHSFSGLSNILSLFDILCFPGHQVAILEVF